MGEELKTKIGNGCSGYSPPEEAQTQAGSQLVKVLGVGGGEVAKTKQRAHSDVDARLDSQEGEKQKQRWKDVQQVNSTGFCDVLTASDNGLVSALVLLDLRAAFDTVDHSILFHDWNMSLRLEAAALVWFRSYLSDGYQFTHVDDVSSSYT